MNNVKKIRKITLFSTFSSLFLSFSLLAMKKSEPTPIPGRGEKKTEEKNNEEGLPPIILSTSPNLSNLQAPKPLRSGPSLDRNSNSAFSTFSSMEEVQNYIPTLNITNHTPSPTRLTPTVGRRTPSGRPETSGALTCLKPSLPLERKHTRHTSCDLSSSSKLSPSSKSSTPLDKSTPLRSSWDVSKTTGTFNLNTRKTPEQIRNENIINILKEQDVDRYQFIIDTLNQETCLTKKAELFKLIFDNICLTEKNENRFRLCSNINKGLIIELKKEQDNCLNSDISRLGCDFNRIVFIDDNHIKGLGYYNSFVVKGKEMLGGGHCWKEYGLPEIIEEKKEASSCCLLKFCPSVENHCTGVCCGNWLYHDRSDGLNKLKSSTLFPWHAEETYKIWECLESAFNNTKKKEIFKQSCGSNSFKIHFLSSYSYYKMLGGSNVKIHLVLRCGYKDLDKTHEVLSAYPLGVHYLNLSKITKSEISNGTIPYHSVRLSEKSISPDRLFEDLSLLELMKEGLVAIKEIENKEVIILKEQKNLNEEKLSSKERKDAETKINILRKEINEKILHSYPCKKHFGCTCSIIPIRNNIVVDDAIVLKIHHSDFRDTTKGFEVSVMCNDGKGELSFDNSSVTTTTPSPTTINTPSPINLTCKNLEKYEQELRVLIKPLERFNETMGELNDLLSSNGTDEKYNKLKCAFFLKMKKNIESMIKILDTEILNIHKCSIFNNEEFNPKVLCLKQSLTFIDNLLLGLLNVKGKALKTKEIDCSDVETINQIKQTAMRLEMLFGELFEAVRRNLNSYNSCH